MSWHTKLNQQTAISYVPHIILLIKSKPINNAKESLFSKIKLNLTMLNQI